VIKTVPYKGSKKKLLPYVKNFADEIGANTIFDAFSGCGVVSAYLRQAGHTVFANDLNYSSYIYSRVFLEGYDLERVQDHVDAMNNLEGVSGWVTENYSGTRSRVIRGTGGAVENRPCGFKLENAKKIDAAREYIKDCLEISECDKNALIFSVILGANEVFNNTSDQKSAFKNWMERAKKDVIFELPTLVSGPRGTSFNDNIYNLTPPTVDMVYLDPPYTHGVLYASCYHLNDSLALWDKPSLNREYALPRPDRASFRNKEPGKFYSKKTIQKDFRQLLNRFSETKRIVLSYSDAPRNTIKIKKLIPICKDIGKVKVFSAQHKICTQFNIQKKWSSELKEFFIVIDF